MKLFHLAGAVFCLTLLVYAPSVSYEFVAYDDYEYVYQNENVLTGLTASNIVWAVNSCGYASNWHPFCWWSLQADASLASCVRRDPSMRVVSSVMHGHNVLLHAANAVLLFLLLIVMGRKGGFDFAESNACLLCAAFALLWAIHPLRSEVVCWVSERKELSSVFWMLASMLFWVARRRDAGKSYFASLMCFVLALLAKPVAVTLPVALFAWEWVIVRKPFLKCVALIAVFGLLSFGTSVLTLLAQTESLETGAEVAFPMRISMAFYAPVAYVRQTLIPYGLSAFYALPETVPMVKTALGVMLLLMMSAVVIRWIVCRERWAAICTFGVAWAYVALIPMLGFVKVGSQPHSDRYTYWAGCAAVSVVWMLVARLNARGKALLVNLSVCLLIVFAVLTFHRNAVWKTSFALFSDAVRKSWHTQAVCSLSSQFMHNGEKGAAQAEAMLREAIMHSRAIDIRAEFARVAAFRAKSSPILLDPEDGDPAFAEARMDAESVLRQFPSHPRAHEALAFIAMKEGKPSEALRHLEEAQKTERKEEQAWLSELVKACRRQVGER